MNADSCRVYDEAGSEFNDFAVDLTFNAWNSK
jgi:hypothetical protein